MNRALIKKCLRESRWLLLACMSAIYFFCWLRVWMVSRLDTSRFKAILDALPGDFKKFTTVDLDWMITYTGRISLGYDEPIVVFCVSIWAIARGSDCVSGELNRGTMEMLLAQPVSRLQVLFTQSAVNILGIVLLATSAWLGTFTGIQTNSTREETRPSIPLPFSLPFFGNELANPFVKNEIRRTPMSEKVDSAVFIPASVNLCSLGIFWAGVAMFVSACDRYRWRTLGIVIGIYVLQMAFKIIGMAAESWSWLRNISIFTAYEPEAFVHLAEQNPENTWSLWLDKPHGTLQFIGPLGYDLILIALGYLALLLAAIIFHRRDLPAPQ
jgi:ABC-2 type transport system permease protein